MADKLICGVDVGSTKIATICALPIKDNEEIRIIGYNQTVARGIKKGLIVDIDEATLALEESIEKAERMSGHKISEAFVSIGGPHINSFNSHGIVAVANPQDEITEEDIIRVIEAARAISISNTREIIDVRPRDYIVDGQAGIKNPIGMSGVRLEVDTHIITASHTNMKNLNRCLNDVGINNRGFIFSGLAAAEAVLTDTEKELGVVLADIGGGKTDLCVYVEGALAHSGSLPIGAKNITNDIAVGLRISLDSAEKLKTNLQTLVIQQENKIKKKIDDIDLSSLNLPEGLRSVSLKTLIDGIMLARIEEIYKMIFDEIEKSGFSQNIPSGLVVTGGGGLTYKMIDFGRKILGLTMRLGIPEKVTGLTDEILSPPFASTIGLILYGVKNFGSREPGFKNFDKVLKDFSLTNSIQKLKSLIKQFIP